MQNSLNTRNFFNIEDETWICLSLWTLITYESIVGSINKLFNMFVESGFVWDSAIYGALSAIVILLGTAAAAKRLKRRDYLVMGFIIFFWLMSFLLNENARIILKLYYFKPVMIEGMCGIICFAHIADWKRFSKIGMIYCSIGLTMFLGTMWNSIITGLKFEYMSTAYGNVAVVIGMLWISLKKKNIFAYVLSALSIVTLVVIGCRGALLCAVIYLAIEFLFNINIKAYFKILAGVLALVVFLNIEPILLQLQTVLDKYDYDIRIVNMYMDENITYDSGREVYHEQAREVIKENLIIGCGAAGSSYPLYEKVKGGPPIGVERTYSHNLIYDILMDFGIFIGGAILLALIILIVRAYFKVRKQEAVSVLFIFFSATIPKLMFSSTYIGEPIFFMFIGLLMNLNFEYLDNQESDKRGAENA